MREKGNYQLSLFFLWFYDVFLGPPLINYTTHPRYPDILSGGTQTASLAPPGVSALAAPTSSTELSNSNPQLEPPPTGVSALAAPTSSTELSNSNPQLEPPPIKYATHPRYSSPTAPQPVSAVEEIISLADALSINNNSFPGLVPVAPPQRRRGKSKYYSVVVGRCCGVYSSW
jgi:hypothetical protein